MIKILAMFVLVTFTAAAQTPKESPMAPLYTFTMKTIDGKEKSLADYKGDVLLIVNVASFCGNTPNTKTLKAFM